MCEADYVAITHNGNIVGQYISVRKRQYFVTCPRLTVGEDMEGSTYKPEGTAVIEEPLDSPLSDILTVLHLGHQKLIERGEAA